MLRGFHVVPVETTTFNCEVNKGNSAMAQRKYRRRGRTKIKESTIMGFMGREG